MPLKDGYGMISTGSSTTAAVGKELREAPTEARRATPEKKPTIWERMEDAKRECGAREVLGKSAPQKKPPELGDL